MESIKFDDFRALYCEQPEEMVEIAQIFCTHAQGLVQKLQLELNDNDEYMYLIYLHQLKGSVGYLYLHNLVNTIIELESEIAVKSLTGVGQLHDNLMNLLNTLIEKVEGEIVMSECI
ncbi:Hpt domain-containing protein [Thalassotalea nanhaiensis]|uniref:Hpt domain-containing protein n=1 Tax=Thalassotalea nanhaiensis TaxID=3065648 RepID=A0ABY9TL16_9GAMM|nr:Hpt domain-containing protein [Colwelliaceae bacterium SQ345]